MKISLNQSMVTRYLVVLLAVTGIASGFLLGQFNSSTQGSVSLEFETSQFSKGILQGEVVRVPFSVKNTGPTPITVLAVNKSCGCISILSRDGRALDLPHELKPNTELQGDVSLSTESKSGLSIQPLSVDYDSSGEAQTCTAELKLHVCPGPHSLSGPIILNTDNLQGTATIGDAFPVGIEFSDVRVESLLIESAQLEKLETQADHALPSSSSLCQVVPRYHINVVGKKSDHDYRGYVMLIPKKSDLSPVHVPVHFRTSRNNSSWKVFPVGIFIRPSESGAVRREIHVIGPAAGGQELSVSASSSNIHTDSKRMGRLLTISVNIEKIEELTGEDLVSIRNNSGEVIGSVPIKFVKK